MDATLVPTVSALTGTVIGGLTTFATSWLNQTAQSRSQKLAQERAKREELYGGFLDEVSRLYSRALSEEKVEHDEFVRIFGLRGRILLGSSDGVVAATDLVVRTLLDVWMAPNRSDAEIRTGMEDDRQDLLGLFARACRVELKALRV